MSINSNQDQIYSNLSVKETIVGKKIICNDIVCNTINNNSSNNLTDFNTLVIYTRGFSMFEVKNDVQFIINSLEETNFKTLINNGSYIVNSNTGQILIPSSGLYKISVHNSGIQYQGTDSGLLFIWFINDVPQFINDNFDELKLSVIFFITNNYSSIFNSINLYPLENTQYTHLNAGDVLDLRFQTIFDTQTISMNSMIIEVKKVN